LNGRALEKTVISETAAGVTAVETKSLPPINGIVTFVPVPKQIQVRLEVAGLTAGNYVASVHEFGDIADVLHGSPGPIFGLRRTSQPIGMVGSFRPTENGSVAWAGGYRAMDLDNIVGRAIIVSRVTPSPNGPQYLPVASGVIGIANPERFAVKPTN
jgi:hypothetical protein